MSDDNHSDRLQAHLQHVGQDDRDGTLEQLPELIQESLTPRGFGGFLVSSTGIP